MGAGGETMRNREVERGGGCQETDRDMGRERGENKRDIQEGTRRYGKTDRDEGDRHMERQIRGWEKCRDRETGTGVWGTDKEADEETRGNGEINGMTEIRGAERQR